MTEILRHIRTGGVYEVLYRGARLQTAHPLQDYDIILVYQCTDTGAITACSSPELAPAGHRFLYVAAIQTGAPLCDGAEVVIYRALTGNLAWIRSTAEMDDGRFKAAPVTHRAGAVSILDERVKASLRYFRDGAAVQGGVCADEAARIAVVLQDLLSEPVPPRAAEPPGDATGQASRLSADEAETRPHLWYPGRDGRRQSVTRIPDYDRGYRDGLRAAVTWLAARAGEMNDPHAKAALNTAATNLGWDASEGRIPSKARHRPTAAIATTAEGEEPQT